MSGEISVIELSLQHGGLFLLVLACLLVLSLGSWTVIFQKWAVLRMAKRELGCFAGRSMSPANALCEAPASDSRSSGVEHIVAAGLNRVAQLRNHSGLSNNAVLEQARHAWESTLSQELRRLSGNLSFLATIGSVSPYLGLFGTVWGVIDALAGLGDVREFSLVAVAPGISEALIATAAGLLAAIPAIVAHNRYVAQIDTLADEYLSIVDDVEYELVRAHAPDGSGRRRRGYDTG